MINHCTAHEAFEALIRNIHYGFLRKKNYSGVATALELYKLPTRHTAEVYAMLQEWIVPLHEKGFMSMLGSVEGAVEFLNKNTDKNLIVEVSGNNWLERFHSECFLHSASHYVDMCNLGYYILATTGGKHIECTLCRKPLP